MADRELVERLAYYSAIEARLTAVGERNDSLRIAGWFGAAAGAAGLFAGSLIMIGVGIAAALWLFIDWSAREKTESELRHAREMVKQTRDLLGPQI